MESLQAKTIDIFLALLRSGLYGTTVPDSELPESIDWSAVVKLARNHGVLGTIIDSVSRLPENLRPDAALSAKMTKFAMGLIRTNLVLDRTVGRLAEFLGSHGVNGVLLKGQGVARYYRQPQMRQSGDIDFYVGKEQYARAVELCLENLADDKETCKACDKHFDFDMNSVHIELHRLAALMYSPFRKKKFQRWVVEQLEHSPNRRAMTVGDAEIILPSYDFDALYIFYHAWFHYLTGGIGLRQLCDWVLLLREHSNDIDFTQLVENLRQFGLINGWKIFACIAVEYLGLPDDKIPLYDSSFSKKSKKVLEEIISGGNFGYFSDGGKKLLAKDTGFVSELRKLPVVTGYFVSLFPVVPVEATFLYFHRLFSGTMLSIRTAMKKMKNS